MGAGNGFGATGPPARTAELFGPLQAAVQPVRSGGQRLSSAEVRRRMDPRAFARSAARSRLQGTHPSGALPGDSRSEGGSAGEPSRPAAGPQARGSERARSGPEAPYGALRAAGGLPRPSGVGARVSLFTLTVHRTSARAPPKEVPLRGRGGRGDQRRWAAVCPLPTDDRLAWTQGPGAWPRTRSRGTSRAGRGVVDPNRPAALRAPVGQYRERARSHVRIGRHDAPIGLPKGEELLRLASFSLPLDEQRHDSAVTRKGGIPFELRFVF